MQKTHKGIAKRFKVSAGGKVLRRKPGHRHLLRRKSTKQLRAMGQDQTSPAGLAKRIKKALPKSSR